MILFSRLLAVLAICLATAGAQAATFKEMFPHLNHIQGDERKFYDNLNYRQGQIEILNGAVTLNVSKNYYYLDSKDAEKVLVEGWGNPTGDDTLGMIFRARDTPLADSWGAVITYDDLGYVSDVDADEYDYDELLKEMQASTRAENEDRTKQGYQSIELIGWAAKPRYALSERKLHWAKELEFGGDGYRVLNYNIRALGRKGVLVINFVAGMEKLESVKGSLNAVLAMSTFNEGHRYADFIPGVDQVAAIGIGGLIAGKVAAKAGLFAVALIFLKKFWFIAFLPLIAGWRWLTGSRS